MKWVCPDCGDGGSMRTDRPLRVGVGEDRYELETLEENRCPSCDEVKPGILVGDCPNHGGAPGARYVVYFEEDPRYHYCQKCDTHLYYEQDREEYPHNAQPYCPLCHETKEKTELDFHHWDYETDTGIHMCRACHEKIHGGKTATEQSEDAPHGAGWETVALANLKKLHKELYGDIRSFDAFRKRYNLPEGGVYDDHAIYWVGENKLSNI